MRRRTWIILMLALAAIWAEPLISAARSRLRPSPRLAEAALPQRRHEPLALVPANPTERIKPTPIAALERPLTPADRHADMLASLKWFDTLPGLPTTLLSSAETRNRAERPAMPAASSPSTTATKTAATEPQPGPTWRLLRGAAGHWRLGQTADGVWWFISPDDHIEFMNMVTTVQPYQLPREPQGAYFVSRDFKGDVSNPGDLTPWARQTMKRVLDSGFKGVGAWSHRVFHEMPIAMTRDLNIWAAAPKQAARLYHPDWAPAAEACIRSQVQPLRDNRYLVGYFLDNELDFSDGAVGPGAYFNYLPAEDPNRQQVVGVLRQLWPDLAAFNSAWRVELKDWNDLSQWKEIPHEPAESYALLRSRWLEHLMGDYFRITTDLIHKYDPNHLILGVRFAGFSPSEVARAARPYTDAQSVNYYVADALLDPTIFQTLHEQSDQPVIVSEYSFHSLDGRSGNRNTAGFAAQVMNQAARAEGYRLMTTRLARVSYIIGADWFQWSDEPPSGRSADGEDVNFGVVDIDDHPYTALVDAVRQTASRLNAVHASSAADEQADVWRPSPARPTARVAYLSAPIRLDGRLNDWPEANRLQGLRLSQTVGLSSAEVRTPTVMLGWRPEGIYMAMDVPDADPVTAPLSGRWWTRDCVEFWIATRKVHELESTYSEACHQFFFIPLDPAANNGTPGAVGQWHRPGDALKDNLVPHPDIRYCCRIMADHYVVEMFIPKSALNGFNPSERSDMAFNVSIRDYRDATTWYWAASKELYTQSRPTTWGDIRLMPPGTVVAARADAR